MITAFQYLTEDFNSGYQQFVNDYVTPTENQKFNPDENLETQIQKLKLFLIIYGGRLPEEIIRNFYDYYYYDRDQDLDYDEFLSDVDVNEYENFFESFKYHLTSKVDDVYDEIKDYKRKDGTFEIFRALEVGENWTEHLRTQGKRLGIYWSMKETGADTYWGDEPRTPGYTQRVKTVITSSIHENAIDWIATIALQIDHSLGEEESEIRLFKGTPLKILAINNEPVDEQIANKTFYA